MQKVVPFVLIACSVPQFSVLNSNNDYYGDVRILEIIERKIIEKGKIILQKKELINLPEGVDAEFTKILNEVIREHDQAFRGLVDR